MPLSSRVVATGIDGVTTLADDQRSVVTNRALQAIQKGDAIPVEARFGRISNSGFLRIDFNPKLEIDPKEAKKIMR